MPLPAIGRIVLYRVTGQDAAEINKRRMDATSHLAFHREMSNGVQIHVGNNVEEGDIYPMMIVRVLGVNENSSVNGHVFLDGNDTLWVTSVAIGEEAGSFYWSVRS